MNTTKIPPTSKQASWHIRTVPDNVLWRPILHFAIAATCMGALAWLADAITVHCLMDEASRQACNDCNGTPTVLGFLQDMSWIFFGSISAGVAGFLPIAMVSLYFARRKQSLALSAWVPGLVVAGIYLLVMLVCYATWESEHPDRHVGLIIRNILAQLLYPVSLLVGTWSLHRAYLRSQGTPEPIRLYRHCQPKLILTPYVHFAVWQAVLLVLACAPPLISHPNPIRTQVMPLAMLGYCLLYSSIIYLPLAWYSLYRAQRLRSIARAVWPPALGLFAVYAAIVVDDYYRLTHSTPEYLPAYELSPDYVGCSGFDLTIICPMLALIPATFMLHRYIRRYCGSLCSPGDRAETCHTPIA